jgi:hypothetical protein
MMCICPDSTMPFFYILDAFGVKWLVEGLEVCLIDLPCIRITTLPNQLT